MKNQKSISYLFPDKDNVPYLKIFQDRTNQIRGIYFTKNTYNQVQKMENASNYAIYFLFSNDDDTDKIYIGQSIDGQRRISDHIKDKPFWSYAIMFITDNNSFDKSTIDYLEYYFINCFKKSNYTLLNKDLRLKKPNVSDFDRPKLFTYIEYIKFLLSAENVIIPEDDSKTETSSNDKNITYYINKSYPKSKVYFENGKFILCKGSVVNKPKESSRNWSSNFYETSMNNINSYLKEGKITEENGVLFTTIPLSFKSPSSVAKLISGNSVNGWLFFDDLDDLRKNS